MSQECHCAVLVVANVGDAAKIRRSGLVSLTYQASASAVAPSTTPLIHPVKYAVLTSKIALRT